MFPRDQRLTRQKDVQRVYKHGISAGSRWLFIRSLQNKLNTPRMTVIIGKKVAKRAVDRNRLKRLVRQSLLELSGDASIAQRLTSRDLIITIHRAPEAPATLTAMKEEVQRCFARLP